MARRGWRRHTERSMTATRSRRGDAAQVSARRSAPAAGLASYFDAARWANLAWDVWLGGWADAGAVQRVGERRLRDLLSFVRRASPLYRELYADLPAGAALRLTDLPPVSKALLMHRFDAWVTDPQVTRAGVAAFTRDPDRVGQPFLGRYAVWSSSGTTGEPGWFVHDADALAVYEALEMFRFRGISSPAELTARMIGGERYAMVAATGGHFAGVSTVEHLRRTYPWLAAGVRAFSLLQPLPALVAQLNDYQPNLLATYPTAAEMLADELEAGRLRIRLTELWTGGECLHPAVRQRLQARFGCRVRDGYGASEFMSIAWDCGHGHLHVNADWVLLEPVDARGRAVEPGVASHTVLLTNLANRVQPLIRYDLGDSVTWCPDPCPCGSPLPAIDVIGRHDDVLVFSRRGAAPVKVLPLVITTVLEEDAGVHDFQLEQTGARRLRLTLGAAEAAAGRRAQSALSGYLRANGVSGVAIDVDRAEPRRSARSGKLRRVVCSARRCVPALPCGAA